MDPQADPNRRRNTKRLMVTMGALVATILLMSAVAPGLDRASAAEGASPEVTLLCTYEAANGGDIFASQKPDPKGSAVDGVIDQGGCVLNAQNHGECVTTLARSAAVVGVADQDLWQDVPLDDIANQMTLGAEACEGIVEPDLRVLPASVASSVVDIRVYVNDDAFGYDVSGAVCTDGPDDDHIACESVIEEERHGVFCNGGGAMSDVDLTAADHVVVFLDGPANAEATYCADSPIGGTSGGIYEDPAPPENHGILIEFWLT